MGLISSALTAGRNALLSYQGALQVVGNNVANAGNADYTRQSAQLSAVQGVRLGPGLQPGAGVALTGVRRQLDEALENRLRAATGERESAAAERSALLRIETFFDDQSGAGISRQLTDFFNAMSDVQNAPNDIAIRGVAVSTADSLASALQAARRNLVELGQSLNDEIELAVVDADRLAREIAQLNTEITTVEAGGNGQAGALRDRRDALIRELSQTFDVQVREQPDGSASVYVGSEPLVQHGSSRGLTTVSDLDGQFERLNVRFADTNARINVRGGRIEGLIRARDEQGYGRVTELDELAAGLIGAVNAVHADGQGLSAFAAVVGSENVADPDAALNSAAAGLLNPPTNGSFFITVADEATGTPVAYAIDVDLDGVGTDTSLNDLVASINGTVNGVTAAVTVDNRLELTADTGFTFTFGHDGDRFRGDSARVLSGLGINTLFRGSNASNIEVRDEVVADPNLLAAATQNRVGDGQNAGRVAGVLNEATDLLGGLSLLDNYNAIAGRVATAGFRAAESVEATEAVALSLQTQRESISGVSLDEESIDLLRYERAFQGAARYVTTVDRLMQELLAIAS